MIMDVFLVYKKEDKLIVRGYSNISFKNDKDIYYYLYVICLHHSDMSYILHVGCSCHQDVSFGLYVIG